MSRPKRYIGIKNTQRYSIYLAKHFKVLDDSKAPLYYWYPDGKINICYNAIDRHVDNGNGDDVALIYDSVYNGIQDMYTYKEV